MASISSVIWDCDVCIYRGLMDQMIKWFLKTVHVLHLLLLNHSGYCYCTLPTQPIHISLLPQELLMYWYCSWQYNWLWFPHTSPNKCSASLLLFQFGQNQQGWSLWSQQPLRGAPGYGPSICTVPFDSNEPTSSKILGAVLWDDGDIFSSPCNSNCSCSQLFSILQPWSSHIHYIWWN